ncbi:MAG: hypothetical protein JSV04_09395 [Candidatus Heimdallarchaeota archaeon]|nr:MAG: hypothetical protein JSV04_09395 [Candidatus Heimdallarchaeota archaeon]
MQSDNSIIYSKITTIEQSTLSSGSAWLWDAEFHGYTNSGFLFSTGSRITIGSSDVYYGHYVTQGSGPRLWTNNGLGHVIDLGEVDFETTSTVPSSGWTQTYADAYEGHVYGIQTRDASHYAKLLVKKIDDFGIWFDWVYQSDGSYYVPGYNVNSVSNPWIDITSPTDYSTRYLTFPISWNQGAAGSIVQAEIYANGTLLKTLTSGETSSDVQLTSAGLYVISIIVIDDVGGRAYDSVPIYFEELTLTSGSTWLWDAEFHGYANSGFLFSSGTRVDIGDSDVYYGHYVTQGSGPRLWTNNGLGHIIDFGEVDFATTSSVPSSGWTQTYADAYEGHVYGIQTRDASHYAKLLVKKIDEFGIWFDWVYQADGSYYVPGYNINGISNPWVDITSPSPYSILGQDFSIIWNQGAAGSITMANVYANGTLLERLSSGETSANVQLTESGLYVISIIVTDDDGLRNYDSVAIFLTPGMTTSTTVPSTFTTSPWYTTQPSTTIPSSSTQPSTTVSSSTTTTTTETTDIIPGVTSGYELIPLTVGLLLLTVIFRKRNRKEM